MAAIYNVHLYREMRLYYPGIEAGSLEEAAEIAAQKRTEDAETIEDCEGTNLAALVDVQGDDQYDRSRTNDFPISHNSRLFTELLESLKDLHDQLECIGMDTSKMPSLARSKAAIAKADKQTGGRDAS